MPVLLTTMALDVFVDAAEIVHGETLMPQQHQSLFSDVRQIMQVSLNPGFLR